MKVDLTRLLDHARDVTHLAVSERMEVLSLGAPVEAETGERTVVSAEALRGLDVWEAARVLHDTYAGDVAFVIRTPSALAVVRPPFSELPIYYWRDQDTLRVWSGLASPKALLDTPPDFDLDYLAGVLLNPAWQTPATGLDGVSELLSGGVLVHDGTQPRQVDLLAEAVLRLATAEAETGDYDEQVAKFHRLILKSVRHKTEQDPQGFSINCSGGLDSTVVTVAAAELYPERRLPLLNSYSEEDPHGDERYFFNAVSERVRGSPVLVETHARSSRSGLSSELLMATPRPCKLSGTVATTGQLYAAARANGSRIVLSGDGGDQLFLRNSRALFSRELMGEADSPSAALRAMAGVAIQDRCSFWRVAREALTGTMVRRYRHHFFGELRFPRSPLSEGDIPEEDLVPHGARLAGLSTSRAFQYFGMRNAEMNRIGFKACPIDERKPFVFWPLIRAALAARREHHLAEGRDRALERDAFKKQIPRIIYDRMGKGAGRDILVRFDYDALAAGLLTSPVCEYELVSRERLHKLLRHEDRIDEDTAFALVGARAIADWMELYERA